MGKDNQDENRSMESHQEKEARPSCENTNNHFVQQMHAVVALIERQKMGVSLKQIFGTVFARTRFSGCSHLILKCVCDGSPTHCLLSSDCFILEIYLACTGLILYCTV